MKAYFPVSEQEYFAMADRIARDRQPWDQGFGLTLILAGGVTHGQKGAFLAADREVDQKTGTIRLAATFANPGNVLRPGQYGRVRAVTKTAHHAVVVPERAITELQGQYQVHIVGQDNKIAVRTVTVGERLNGEWIVTSGLTPGERVAVDGAQFLSDGTTVTPRTFTPSKQR
ncbi:MAG TPA: efflux RND transporter periplasmic adaptor subunit [Vicinamibacterales bacterium]|nr:efflux RND transporter periplasmic adaptor subunit [Vicinamibacterales bacterium]